MNRIARLAPVTLAQPDPEAPDLGGQMAEVECDERLLGFPDGLRAGESERRTW